MGLGDRVYHYSIRGGKLIIKEGTVVVESGVNRCCKHIRFDNGGWEYYVTEKEFDKLITAGPSIWLKERDDKKAIDMFIRYENECIDKLQKKIDYRRKIINDMTFALDT